MAEENHKELQMEVAETWSLEAVERLLVQLTSGPKGSPLGCAENPSEEDSGEILRCSMAVYLAPIPDLYLCLDGARPLESPVEARKALRRLEAALVGLGPLAYLNLNRSLRRLGKVQTQAARSDAAERVDLRILLEAVRREIASASAKVQPGPRADAPFGSAGPPSKLTRELALAYYRLLKEPPPTTHPDQRTSREHPYHTLFREAFDLAGYSAWKKSAQKAASWLRRSHRRLKLSLNRPAARAHLE